ncbi:PLP-dependent aminotransferase family protein [Fodinicola acaciae]|uniref:MocR-like pyridoxine biosynthesis transcription factor PdxR n=1 Tax=Fodinicola acaciae TaxID=2681555 RepID=UPI0013D68155|nr:PLP-dependent aminotransferase family protein [Fodinicola acaciae]
MVERWTRSTSLHLELDRSAGRRRALEQALRAAISSGQLAAGTALPSSRLLAADIGVGRGTVVEAYAQLVAEGYLVSHPRAGTRVAAAVRASADVVAAKEKTREPEFDLRPWSSDVSAFPRAAWASAVRQVMRDLPDRDLRYGDPRGHELLRQELAGYLGRVRGVRVGADQVMVCSGFSHALALLSQYLRRSGRRRLALEDPCLAANRETAVFHGLSTVDVPVDRGGMDVSRLRDVDAVLVTPAHQFPYGVPLAAPRRTELLAVAERMLVIEDDYDGEFRYDRQPVGALQGLAPDRVVYVGTTSKSLAPAMRLAWMAVPAPLMPELVRIRELTDRHCPVIDQLALAHLIGTGSLDRHLRRVRGRYRARRDALMSALTAVPSVRALGVAAGYYATLLLPPGVSDTDVSRRLAERGVHVDTLSRHRGSASTIDSGLVVGYGTPPQHQFAAALEAFIAALHASGL